MTKNDDDQLHGTSFYERFTGVVSEYLKPTLGEYSVSCALFYKIHMIWVIF